VHLGVFLIAAVLGPVQAQPGHLVLGEEGVHSHGDGRERLSEAEVTHSSFTTVRILLHKRVHMPCAGLSNHPCYRWMMPGMANLERRLADEFWDVRDDACDHPERWQGVTAEAVFQRLAEVVEQAETTGRQLDWRRDVVEPLIAWRISVDHH
jgi:hypothetical protein